jgi:hypothetical protein
MHGMDLPLALHNLEKTLTQLTKFLVTEEPEPDIETKLVQLEQRFKSKEIETKETIDKNILQLEYHLQAYPLLVEKLNISLENLYKLPLKSAQYNFPRIPMNAVANKADIELSQISDIMKNLEKYENNIYSSLSNIGAHFRQNSFNSTQKKTLSSLLAGQDTKTIKNVLQKAQNTLQQLTGREPWIWYVGELSFPITYFLKTIVSIFNCILQINTIAFPRIQELIEDDQKSIKNDIQNIERLQQTTLEIYNQILDFLAKMQKVNMGTITEQEANVEIKKFMDINTDPLSELNCLIVCIIRYMHFIKDESIRNKLSKTIADTLSGKNFSANLQKQITAANVLTNFPNTKKQIEYIQFLFKRIEKNTGEMDTASKNIKI